MTETFSEETSSRLIIEAEDLLSSMGPAMEQAKEMIKKAGLSLRDSSKPIASITTGGYSNTDHSIRLTGDYKTDRILQLQRDHKLRNSKPESRSEERWDKPRAPGERRRRIARDEKAPIEPPPSGYIVFVGQMTTKTRHDHPNEPYNQAETMKYISGMWNHVFSEEDRERYNKFARVIQKEYKKQVLQFRATGEFKASDQFLRVRGTGPCVPFDPNLRSELEREICGYKTVHFPPRPPEMDEEYRKREVESKRKRKLKLQMEREKRRKEQQQQEEEESASNGEDEEEDVLENHEEPLDEFADGRDTSKEDANDDDSERIPESTVVGEIAAV